MKLIKLAFISAIAFFLLITGISLLMPSTVRISRAVDIQAPVSAIQPLVNDISKWEDWNIYADSLRNKKIISVESLVSDDTDIRIYSAGSEEVRASWQQKNGQLFTSVFRFLPHQEMTTVQWYFDFKLKWYPWEKFSSIIYDQQFGPVMDASLNNLKSLAEAKP